MTEGRAQGLGHGGDIDRAELRSLASRAEAVPVVVEDPGHLAQPTQREPEHQRPAEHLPEVGFGVEVVDQRHPAPVEADRGLDLVLHFEAGGQAGLEGELAEETAGEAVQRGDGDLVHVGQHRLHPAPSFVVEVEAIGLSLQLLPHPVPQLGRGGLGEGDGGQLPGCGDPAADDQFRHPAHESRRLPRARPRLDEQGPVEIEADAFAGVLVGREIDHGHGSSPSASST